MGLEQYRGVGRPREYGDRVRMTLWMPRETRNWIDANRHGQSLTVFTNHLIRVGIDVFMKGRPPPRKTRRTTAGLQLTDVLKRQNEGDRVSKQWLRGYLYNKCQVQDVRTQDKIIRDLCPLDGTGILEQVEPTPVEIQKAKAIEKERRLKKHLRPRELGSDEIRRKVGEYIIHPNKA
jgi:hypothetical protein